MKYLRFELMMRDLPITEVATAAVTRCGCCVIARELTPMNNVILRSLILKSKSNLKSNDSQKSKQKQSQINFTPVDFDF